MKVVCKLNSIGNLRLLSHFSPEKFEFDLLQNASVSDIDGAFLTYLKSDIRTFNLKCMGNLVELELYKNDDYVFEDNFKPLKSMNIDTIYIDTYLSFNTDNDIEYTNCKLIDMKFINNTLRALLCTLDGYNNDFLAVDILNYKACIVSKNNYNMCKKLIERI